MTRGSGLVSFGLGVRPATARTDTGASQSAVCSVCRCCCYVPRARGKVTVARTMPHIWGFPNIGDPDMVP